MARYASRARQMRLAVADLYMVLKSWTEALKEELHPN